MSPALEFADGVLPRRRRLPFVIAVAIIIAFVAMGLAL